MNHGLTPMVAVRSQCLCSDSTDAASRDHAREGMVQTGVASNLGRKADLAAETLPFTLCRNKYPHGRGHRDFVPKLSVESADESRNKERLG